jgi:hypothetical protein
LDTGSEPTPDGNDTGDTSQQPDIIYCDEVTDAGVDGGGQDCVDRPDVEVTPIPGPIDTTNCATGGLPANAEMVADFEEGTSKAIREGSMGVYAMNDETGEQEPDPSLGADAPATQMDACSPFALCVHGKTGFDHWGSGIRVDLNFIDGINDYNRIPEDLTAYRGIGFWAISIQGPSGIRVSFPDTNTDPAGGLCFDANAKIPIWEDNFGRPSEEKMEDCENDWGQKVTMKQIWTYHEVTFDRVGISSYWGRQVQDQGLLQDQIFGLKFQRDPLADPYIFCIDELALLPK